MKGIKACTDVDMLCGFLQNPKKTLFLCSYQSTHIIDEALENLDRSMDLRIFGEAHNVHTPKRYFLWGGEGGEEFSDDEDGKEEKDADESNEDYIEDGMSPSEDGIKYLNRKYPEANRMLLGILAALRPMSKEAPRSPAYACRENVGGPFLLSLQEDRNCRKPQ